MKSQQPTELLTQIGLLKVGQCGLDERGRRLLYVRKHEENRGVKVFVVLETNQEVNMPSCGLLELVNKEDRPEGWEIIHSSIC